MYSNQIARCTEMRRNVYVSQTESGTTLKDGKGKKSIVRASHKYVYSVRDKIGNKHFKCTGAEGKINTKTHLAEEARPTRGVPTGTALDGPCGSLPLS
jgi:hypothetical protein